MFDAGINVAAVHPVIAGHQGATARGYLGIALQSVRLPEALRRTHAFAQEGAVIVVDAAPDGPADRAGLTIGDVVVALGGRNVEDADDLQRALGTDSVGKALPLRFIRAGAVHEVAVTIAERPYED